MPFALMKAMSLFKLLGTAATGLSAAAGAKALLGGGGGGLRGGRGCGGGGSSLLSGAASLLGAKAIVVHPCQHVPYADNVQYLFDCNMDFYRSLGLKYLEF